MKKIIRAEYLGLLIGITILILAQIVPSLNSFFWRSPTPALFFFGSFIWWISQGIIPPVKASLLLIVIFTLGFPTLIAYIIENTKGPAKWAVLLLGIAAFIFVFWVLGIPHLHHYAPEFDVTLPTNSEHHHH